MKFEDQNVITSLRNISGGGILFKIDHNIPIGSILAVKLSLPIIDKTINALLEVIRLKKSKNTNRYLIGAKFREIKDEDRNAIIGIVESTKEAGR